MKEQDAIQRAGSDAAMREGGGASAEVAWQRLHAAACAPYRPAGRFAWHFARGKLGRDPVFRGMLERGDLPQSARVVDLGCGQGLLASLLQSCADLQRRGAWPAAWPVAASATQYTGIELMSHDVRRAQPAVGALALPARVICGDMRDAPLPPCDLVVMLDVAHYIDEAAQAALLTRVREALRAGAGGRASPAGPRLLLRVGDVAQRRAYLTSQLVDRVVTLVRGHRVPPTWGRPVREWTALLQDLGFSVQSVPMSQGTPFANTLLVADLRPDAA